MLNATNREVTVSKGDTGSLIIRFSGDVPPDGTEVLVTLKKTAAAAKALWEKRLIALDGQTLVRLATEDTSLPPGVYSWDVRLLWAGEVITPAPPRPFIILEVVGDV